MTLPVVLYGSETWPLALTVECRLRVFEKMILRRMFESKRDGNEEQRITLVEYIFVKFHGLVGVYEKLEKQSTSNNTSGVVLLFCPS